MSLRNPIRTPFYGGSGTSPLVPNAWDCAIGGRTYMFDDKFFGTPQHKLSSIRLLRPTQTTGEVTEEAFNPADGVRVGQKSWHHGAGQVHLDDVDSDEFRFRSSKGFDVWTKGKLSLLPDTDQKLSSAQTNLQMVVAGTRLYLIENQTLKYTENIDTDTPTWTTVTGTPAATATSIATDGFTVWVAYTALGLYHTNTGTGAASQLVTTALVSSSVVGYVKGRLMVTKDNVLYNVTDLTGPAALPAVLYTHPNTAFRWVGFTEGSQDIYMAGYSGDKSVIHKTSVKADGTSLDIPTVASSTIPDGETVACIGEYLSVILIGTDKGVWTAAQDDNGNLTVNKVLALTAATLCFEGQGDFVWFGWTNFDAASTGLGRMDLGADTKGGNVVNPAYASDLMVTAQGAVLSCVTFGSQRVFTVSGSGVWAEHQDGNRVASATIDSGLHTFGMPDDKVALNITVRHEPLVGTVAEALSIDGGTFTNVGTSVLEGSTVAYLNPGSATGGTFETRITATRSASDVTDGPVVTRSTLEANMAPGRGQELNFALLFFEQENFRGGDYTFDPVAAYEDLLDLERSGVPTTVQHPLGSVTATLDDHDFIIDGFTEGRDGYVGTFLATFREGRRRT